MTEKNESLDLMFDRIQKNIESLREEREQWLKERGNNRKLTRIMTAIKALTTREK